jgi:hypothetical protein
MTAPQEWLDKRKRDGSRRHPDQWPGYRLSLDRHFNRPIRSRDEAELCAQQLREEIVAAYWHTRPAKPRVPLSQRQLFTYLVHDAPFLKIGRTVNVTTRWPANGCTDNPRDVIVIDVIAKDVEKELHLACLAHHYRGEWFHDHPDVRLAFASMKQQIEAMSSSLTG